VLRNRIELHDDRVLVRGTPSWAFRGVTIKERDVPREDVESIRVRELFLRRIEVTFKGGEVLYLQMPSLLFTITLGNSSELKEKLVSLGFRG
jgi:hypothetical protein